MKPYVTLIILALCAVIFGAVMWWDVSKTPDMRRTTQGEDHIKELTKTPAPEFTFQTMNGETIALQDLEGRIVVINFWASWCVPCVAEFPDLIEMAGANKEHMTLIALSVDEEPDKARAFLRKMTKRHDLDMNADNILIGLDRNKAISQDLFLTVAYPETFILGPELNIRHKITGVLSWPSPKLAGILSELGEK